MGIKIGQIPYLNSEVFYHGMTSEFLELVPLVPRALSSAALADRIDAGPVPLVTCFTLEDRFVPLGDYCIATQEKSHSIFLFSKRPIEELSDTVIGVTGETSTSVRLMKVLFHHRFKVIPKEYVALERNKEAFLLIGDEALRNRTGLSMYPFKYDLGEEWYRWTGLPFVFARWVVRKDLDPGLVQWLNVSIAQSIRKGLAEVQQIADIRKDLNMNRNEIVDYICSFHYRLGANELKSIDRFKELLTTE